MKKRIAILSGDGIGPQVIDQGVKVLDAIAVNYNHQFDYSHALIGAAAIERSGGPLPAQTLDACLSADAILLGTIGDPRFENESSLNLRPEHGLLGLRKALKLFANIRPVYTYRSIAHLSPLKPDRITGVNFTIFRELTSGIYFGEKGTNEEEHEAFDTCIYKKSEIVSIARLAFERAMQRRKKLTLVDKANVLETSRLWRRCVNEVAKEFPEVHYSKMYVDNAAMELIQYPKQFDVILTSNLFGDILSDAASVLVGGLSLLPSASLGTRTSLFGPIHGSFPQLAGQEIVNPVGTILSVAMMLETFGLYKESKAIRYVVQVLLEEGVGTMDLDPEFSKSCSEFGELVASLLEIKNLVHIDKERLREQISTII